MRAVVMSEFGGPEVLRVVERQTPDPGAGQVRIRVDATAIHPVDLWIRSGGLGEITRPAVLGWDLAGVVDTVGQGVTAWRPGDRVVGMTRWFDTHAGTYAEYAVFDAAWIAAAPRTVSPVEAAVLPVNAQTAVQALDLLRPADGQTLAVSGAAGQLGGFVVQLAAARGLRVVAVAGPADESLVRGFGASEFVPRSDEFAAAIRSVLPDGADGLIDAANIGPAAIGAVRDHGAMVAVTANAPAPERGVRVEVVSVVPDGAQLSDLVAAVDAGRLTLRVAETYPFAEAPAAHQRMEKGGLRGRLVLVP